MRLKFIALISTLSLLIFTLHFLACLTLLCNVASLPSKYSKRFCTLQSENMASRDLIKRKQPIPRIEDKEVLGPFPIIVTYVPFFVSDANLQKITAHLINWLMGNNVNIDPKETQKVIDFLFERDHKAFLLLLSGEIKVEEFGPIFFPVVFFSSTPDVLDPYDFQRRRIEAYKGNSSGTLAWKFSESAEQLKCQWHSSS